MLCVSVPHTSPLTDTVTSDTLQRVVPMADGSLWRWQERTWTMGILNVTPDSFSDGGMHAHADAAVQAALNMAAAGVDIVDVGGQSTRPGAALLSAEQEAERVLPVLRCVPCVVGAASAAVCACRCRVVCWLHTCAYTCVVVARQHQPRAHH